MCHALKRGSCPPSGVSWGTRSLLQIFANGALNHWKDRASNTFRETAKDVYFWLLNWCRYFQSGCIWSWQSAKFGLMSRLLFCNAIYDKNRRKTPTWNKKSNQWWSIFSYPASDPKFSTKERKLCAMCDLLVVRLIFFTQKRFYTVKFSQKNILYSDLRLREKVGIWRNYKLEYFLFKPKPELTQHSNDWSNINPGW